MTPFYRFGWILFRALFGLLFRLRVRGTEHVPLRGPAILAANHASFLDPPVIGAAAPRMISYLARDTLFRNRIFGWLLRQWQAVPVDQEHAGAAGIRTILERLAAGHAILIFPEGSRSFDGQLQPTQPGVGLVVVKSGAPVVPVRVFGTHEALPRGRSRLRFHRLSVVFGAPMDFAALRAEAETAPKARQKEIYQEIADEIMAAIARLTPPS
ncbi:MAG: lysophospholipid acyltransferase family protein [Verrucomicrobiales bacterium]|nr:lysophospholipid acyltransferase family protein [Verrucomicrobiales bacterium]